MIMTENIHVLPTDKPSRLLIKEKSLLLVDMPKNYTFFGNIASINIYITSNEEIKEDGTWCYRIGIGAFKVYKKDKHPYGYAKKIILTTDQDLIKDGVQEIDDEFLEWFVKNPSCEEVEVKNSILKIPNRYDDDYRAIPYYKIVIPKEIDVLELGQIISKEKPKYTISNLDNDKYKDFSVSKEKPKQETELDAYYRNGIGGVIQETLEEAAENYDENNTNDEYGKSYRAFIEGAKWQAERMYSEEEVRKAIQLARLCTLDSNTGEFVDLSGLTEVCTYGLKETRSEDSIIEQFKKK